MAEVHVKGLDQLQKLLDTLPAKIEANVMRGALRAGAQVLLSEATYRAPSRTAGLVSSLKIGTRKRGGTVTSYVKTDLFYARFVEFGTRPHTITAKNRKSLSFGGRLFQSVDHPGIAPYGNKTASGPHAFLRPALDTGAQGAIVAAAEYMKRRLSTKEGLDTSYVMIEGDEQ